MDRRISARRMMIARVGLWGLLMLGLGLGRAATDQGNGARGQTVTAAVAATDTPAAPTVTDTGPSSASVTAATTIATIVSPTVPAATLTPVGSPATTTVTATDGVTTTATTTPSTVPPSATPLATDTPAATVAPTPTITDTAITTTVAALNAAPAVTETGLTQGYGRLPLSFVPNQGQVDSAVQFVSRAPGLALYLTAGDATLVLVKHRPHGHRHPLSHGSALLATTGLSATVPISAAAVRLHYVGANTAAQAIGQNPLPGIANYLIGRDPAGWRTGLPTYAQVSYHDVYPGVDLVYYGNQAQLEYDWRVAPGADPHAIAFQVQGARRLRVDGDGALVVSTDVGALVQRAPTVYQQDADGSRHAIAARYTLGATGAQSATVGFEVGAYDPGKPLVIDPVLSYSTYLGGNDGDQGTAIAVDRTGAAYLTGDTYSTNFPTTPGVIQPTKPSLDSNDDAVVTKLNPSGTALVYSTYLGGGGDIGYGIAVDRAGDAYVTGRTASTTFPTTLGAFQRTNLGAPNLYDATFVSKLNPTGGALLYSTYLTAATGHVDSAAIAIDGAGNAYLTGTTGATDFPTTPGAPQTTNPGGGVKTVAFVTKLNPTGSALGYSTYLGGSGGDDGYGIAADAAGNAYVTGDTSSTDFPTTPGAFQTSLGGSTNSKAFVTKLAPAGSLAYSTYLGGGADSGLAIAVDGVGDAYITGNTSSTTFPTTAGAYRSTNPSGGVNPVAFVSKLNPLGNALVYSTYLGGSGGGFGQAMAVDGVGNAYLTGDTYSTNFPATPGAPQTHSGGGSCYGGCSDAFVTKLTATGGALAYSTYLGGSDNDVGQGVAVDRAGNTYVTGYTLSTNFPTVNPLQGTFGGNTAGGTGDAFVAKIGANRLPPTTPPGGSGAVAWHPHQGGGGSIGGGVGLSVDLADGHVDVSVPGLSLPGRGRVNLAFTRSWDSALAQTGADGTGWQSSLTPGISGDLTGVVYYADESGATWPFTYTGSATDPGPYTSYQTTPGKPWQLATSTAGYTLTNFLSSETMTFDGQGRLLADSDAYGNQNAMTYGSNGVTSEANSGGRSLSFGYTNGRLGDAMSPLWQSSGGAQGQHVHYGYNGAGQLTTSTLGAGTTDAVTTTFGYSGTQLTSITTGMGRTWGLGYDGLNRLITVTSPPSGTVGQVGYTPAYTTQYTYIPGQTQVIRGYGTAAALTSTYTLDSAGEATTQTDGLNHSTAATYDADHDILSRTDSDNNTTTFSYGYIGPNGCTGLVTQTVQPKIQAYSPLNASMDAVVTSYTYDPLLHDVIQMTKPEGGIVRYGYDGHHSVITMTVQLNPSTLTWRGSVTAYDQYGEVISMVDGRGVSVSANGTATLNNSAALYTQRMGYDAQGDQTSASTPPITTTLPGGTTQASTPVTTTYSFDGDGDKAGVTSANGNAIASAYDHLVLQRHLVQNDLLIFRLAATHPQRSAGSASLIKGAGQPKNGSVAVVLGRLVTASDTPVLLYNGTTGTPGKALTYDGNGNVIREVDANSGATTSSYDPEGRAVMLTNPVSGTTVMTYSATEKVAEQDTRGNVTTYGYDPAGRLVQASDPVSGTVQYQLDPFGNMLVITSSDRTTMVPIQVEARQYDALNQVLTDTVTGPNSQALATTIRYDHDGNVYQVQQPNGDVTINTYDAADQLRTTEIDPGATSGATHAVQQSYAYDAAGDRIEGYDFDGRHSILTLDGAGRDVQALVVTTAPTGTTTITTTATYDPDGDTLQKTTQTQNGTGPVQTSTTTATYNANDWATSMTDNGLTTAYGYDGAGRMHTHTIIDGNTPVTIALDPGGRATTISENAGGTGPYATTFGYNALNEVVTMAMPGGVQETARYDNVGRVTSVGATGPGTGSPATTLNSAYTYGYNALGWITRTTTLSGTDAMTHDAQGRVTAETGPQVVATGGAYHWAYDQNGNMLSQIGDDGAPVTYTYNSSVPNEVQTMVMGDGQPTSYYGYDTNGDTTSITNGARINTHIVYDAAARPIQVAYIDRGTPTTVTLAYNADGQRAHYTVSVANQPTLDEQFQYRSSQLGQVTVVTGGVTLYVDTYLYNQDGTPLELLRQQGGTTNRYWYVLDGQDNVVALTDVTGKVVDRYAYDPWGELVTDDGANETVPQQLRYRGYWYDEKLSWYWVSVRYYDPETARWLQPDPSEIDGVRTYAYVGDDSIDRSDPTGLSTTATLGPKRPSDLSISCYSPSAKRRISVANQRCWTAKKRKCRCSTRLRRSPR